MGTADTYWSTQKKPIESAREIPHRFLEEDEEFLHSRLTNIKPGPYSSSSIVMKFKQMQTAVTVSSPLF